MKLLRHRQLLIWAARDLARHPVQHFLLFAAVASLVTVAAAVLFFYQGFTDTINALIDKTPALVVRRVTAGGWAPLPVAQALDSIGAIPGVLNPRPRLWGTIEGPRGAVTLVADFPGHRASFPSDTPLPGLSAGEAWIGRGVNEAPENTRIHLRGYHALDLTVKGRFDPGTDMATYGLVLVNPTDARHLLGIPLDSVSDLAIEVYHPQEADALGPALAEAFPWPVQITTRESVAKFYRAYFSRQSGLWAMMMIPTLLTLALIAVALYLGNTRYLGEMGLLKALGWTSGDIARYQFYRAGIVGLSAFCAGIGLSYMLVFWPGSTWPHQLLLGQPTHVPGLHLNASGAGQVILAVIALIIGPYLLAAYWASLRGVSADPADLLDRGY